MSDIVERLRHWPAHEQVRTYEREMHIAETGNSYTVKHVIPQSPIPVMQQAADTIEAQAAEIARLRGALGPFAFLEMEKDEGMADTQYVWETIYRDRVQDWISYEDIAAARTALKGADNDH